MPSKTRQRPKLVRTAPRDFDREVRQQFVKSAIVRVMPEAEIVRHLVSGIKGPKGAVVRCQAKTARADLEAVKAWFGTALRTPAEADSEIGILRAQYQMIAAKAMEKGAYAVAKSCVDSMLRVAASQSIRYAALAPQRRGDGEEDMEAAARLAELRRMSDEDLDALLASELAAAPPVLTVHAGGRR